LIAAFDMAWVELSDGFCNGYSHPLEELGTWMAYCLNAIERGGMILLSVLIPQRASAFLKMVLLSQWDNVDL
jgi:hypothetical protein